jgi:hypothetical protein
MKNLTTILLILCVAILVYLGAEYRQVNSHRDQLSDIIRERDAEIIKYKTENGTIRFEKIALELDQETLKKNFKAEVEDIEKNHEVKLRNLHTYYRGKLSTTGSGLAKIDTVWRDSVKYTNVAFNDGFLDFSGKIQTQGMQYLYTYTDSISVVTHYKKEGKWPWRENQLYVSFFSANPNTELIGARTIAIKKKDRNQRLSIGPGIYITPSGAVIGIGIQYSVIRL